MIVLIDADENTGKIFAIHEYIDGGYVDGLGEQVDWPDDVDTLEFTHYKFVDGELLSIDEDEETDLYFTVHEDDPYYEEFKEHEQQQVIEQQQATLFSMQRRSFLMTIPDVEAVKIPLMFDEWEVDADYKIGDRFQYEGVLFKCVQDHHSQEDWTPPETPSLYARVLATEDEIKEWEQPESTNGYMTGDKVKYDGKTYESLIDNNVWCPADLPQGWKQI